MAGWPLRRSLSHKFGRTLRLPTSKGVAVISAWILATALWRDIGVWDDASNWMD
jgi:hypothetical protein